MTRTSEDAWEFIRRIAETPCNHPHPDNVTDCAHHNARRWLDGDRQGAIAAATITAYGAVSDLVACLEETRSLLDHERLAHQRTRVSAADLRTELDETLRAQMDAPQAPPEPPPLFAFPEPAERSEPAETAPIEYHPWTGSPTQVQALANYIGSTENGATPEELGNTFFPELKREEIADRLSTIAERHPKLGLVARTESEVIDDQGTVRRYRVWKVDAKHLARQTINLDELRAEANPRHNRALQAALTSVEDVQRLTTDANVFWENEGLAS